MMRSIPVESHAPTVHLVEDDEPTRKATARFLQSAGHAVRTYGSGTEFLSAPPIRTTGCIVLDLRLPGPSGLDVQQALTLRSEALPIVFLSGHAEVRDSVQAMKCGAVDFLTKSTDGSALLEAVSRAIARSVEERVTRARRQELQARFDHLSARERDVFAHLISGQLNKQIAFDLDIAEQTTKIHRHRVMGKMQADSIAELVRMASELGLAPLGSVR